MKLYICGSINKLPKLNQAAFDHHASELQQAGYEIITTNNTMPNKADAANTLNDSSPILRQCDGIAVLPDWYASKCSLLEIKTAVLINLPVRSIGDWLSLNPLSEETNRVPNRDIDDMLLRTSWCRNCLPLGYEDALQWAKDLSLEFYIWTICTQMMI